MLSPTIPPSPARDPFKKPGEAQPDVLGSLRFQDETAAPKVKAASGSVGLSLVNNEAIARAIKAMDDPFTLRRGGSSAPTSSGPRPSPGRGPALKVSLAERLAGVALNATWVQGPSRVAVIDGRVYRPGEALESTRTAPDPLIVAAVTPERVWIECQGERSELTFPEIARRPIATAAKPAAPRPVPRPSPRSNATKPRPRGR
jgi:hypothetical protein